MKITKSEVGSWECAGSIECKLFSPTSPKCSPDSMRIALGASTGKVFMLESDSGKTIHTLIGHRRRITSCEWSPDGKRLATASDDRTINIWDAREGANIRTVEFRHGGVISCAWSPDGNQIASSHMDSSVMIWDVKKRRTSRTLKGHTDSAACCTWSPDGKYIAAGAGNSTILIWEAKSGKLIHTLKGDHDWIIEIAWPTEDCITSVSEDGTAQIWDLLYGKCIRTLEVPDENILAFGYHPDGKYMSAVLESGKIKTWQATGLEMPVNTQRGHRIYVDLCTWDGRRFVTLDVEGYLNVWEYKDMFIIESSDSAS